MPQRNGSWIWPPMLAYPGKRFTRDSAAYKIDRQRAEDGLKETRKQLEVGAEILQTYLRLLNRPEELYCRSADDARRELNLASFERLFLDEHRVVDAVLTEPLVELQDAARRHARIGNLDQRDPAEGEPALPGGLSDDGLAVLLANVLSVRGFE